MHALKLGNAEFEGRNNAYLLDYPEEVTLIDTGIATPEIDEQLRERLAEYDREFDDIDTIVLTHWHPDHAGLAGAIQREGGATVYVHEADAPLVRREEDALEAMRALQVERFDEWGMPDEKRAALMDRLDGSDEIAGEPTTVETVADGDRIEVGDVELSVRHAPGHAAGLCCFEFDAGDSEVPGSSISSEELSDPENGSERERGHGHGRPEAFVGDTILPIYTPNVGGADVRVDRPLERYLDTLETIVDRGYDRVWPGHRDVIDEPTERAQFIIDHHRERAERVLDTLDEHGPADPWAVSAHLFGELEGIHIMHGPGEAFAHLDHLERHGLVEETPNGYDLVDEAETSVENVI